MTCKNALRLTSVVVMSLLGVGTLLAQEDDIQRVLDWRGSRAWLGVRVSDITAAKARELKLPDESGALVSQVEEGSPADRAGLAKDDVIVEFAAGLARIAIRIGATIALKASIRPSPESRRHPGP